MLTQAEQGDTTGDLCSFQCLAMIAGDTSQAPDVASKAAPGLAGELRVKWTFGLKLKF